MSLVLGPAGASSQDLCGPPPVQRLRFWIWPMASSMKTKMIYLLVRNKHAGFNHSFKFGTSLELLDILGYFAVGSRWLGCRLVLVLRLNRSPSNLPSGIENYWNMAMAHPPMVSPSESCSHVRPWSDSCRSRWPGRWRRNCPETHGVI